MMIQMLCLKAAEVLLILNRKVADKFTKLFGMDLRMADDSYAEISVQEIGIGLPFVCIYLVSCQTSQSHHHRDDGITGVGCPVGSKNKDSACKGQYNQ